MKRLFAVIILLSVNWTLFGQYTGKLIIYTDLPDASFIPYINDEKMTMVPVDTFETELINVDRITFLIDFKDSTVFDIQKNIEFSNLKIRKFRIVYKNEKKFKKKFEQLTNTGDVTINNEDRKIKDKFKLKDESLKTYLNEFK